MKIKDLKINFRYLDGNIACLSVDSVDGKIVHNAINTEEAIIIFNSLIGEKENCQTVKTLLKENQELKKQLEEANKKLYLCTPEIPQNVHGKYVSYVDLVNEMYELKKQLEEYKEQVHKGLYNVCLPYKTGYNKAIKDKEIQQKEFINYLEDKIHSCEAVSDLLFNSNKEMKVYKEILQKYKEIIGLSDENKTTI